MECDSVRSFLVGGEWCLAQAEEGQTIPTTAEGYAISPTGKQLAVVRTSSLVQVELWDLSSLGKQHVLACDASDAVSRVLYSADGATLAARTTAQKLLLWNTLSGERLAVLTVPDEQGPVSQFWLSPDGRTVAVVGKDSGSVSLWDREGANCVTTIRGTGQPMRLCCFSIDSRVCTVVFADEVWQWERTEAKGQCRIPQTTGFSVRTAVGSAQGEFVAAVTEQGIEIWRDSRSEAADSAGVRPFRYAHVHARRPYVIVRQGSGGRFCHRPLDSQFGWRGPRVSIHCLRFGFPHNGSLDRQQDGGLSQRGREHPETRGTGG